MGYLDKIRQVEREAQKTPATGWLAAWREVAAITADIPGDDPRLGPVQAALTQCDSAFEAGDRAAFQRAAEGVRLATQTHRETTTGIGPGCRIWWEGSRVNAPMEGPAVVLGTFIDTATGQSWCWFTYQGFDCIKACKSVLRWEAPPKATQGGDVAA